jgi:hypothetical protein
MRWLILLSLTATREFGLGLAFAVALDATLISRRPCSDLDGIARAGELVAFGGVSAASAIACNFLGRFTYFEARLHIRKRA